MTRWCACAVVRSNFPGRFKVQKPSHQKDQTQAITKLPQLHFHDSHKSRSVISNIRQTHSPCELLIANSRPHQQIDLPSAQTPVGHETGVKTTVLTQAWIFVNIFSRIRKSSTRISTEMHGKKTLTCFLASHAFTRDLRICFNPAQTGRSHRFRPHGSLATLFQHLNLQNSGQNTLFGPLSRWCACAVVSSNFPGRVKVQKPSHQKDQTQAITKLPQLHFHDSHKSRSVISNIRQTHSPCELLIANSRPHQKIDLPSAQTPVGHETGVKTTVLTQAWIFVNMFSRIRKSSTRISTEMHGKQTSTSFSSFTCIHKGFDNFFNPVQTGRSHRFRPHGSLAETFPAFKSEKFGTEHPVWANDQMVRMRCSAQQFSRAF